LQECSRAKLRQFGCGIDGTKRNVVLPSAPSFHLQGAALRQQVSHHLRAFNVPISLKLLPR
jgi:hypothetical protein